MAAQVGGDQLTKNGIHNVHDLLPLPWDNKKHNEPSLTQEEINKEVEMMRAINQQLKEKNNR